MEERIELKDPEHPEAKAAAEATARLLLDVLRRRKQEKMAHLPGPEIAHRQVDDA